jgi:hypothetical protein
MATVYLKSQSGRSLLHEYKTAPIDPEPYLPSQETTKRAIAELQLLGFKIEARGITLSISGLPELFEQICDVKISLEERTVYEPGKKEPLKKFVFISSQPVMRIKGLNDIIDGIVISSQGIPFEGYDLQE